MILFFIFSLFPIDSIINHPDLKPANIGIYVLNLQKDSVVYAYNSEKLLIPASNMKIITIAAALYYLGPQYRFKTRLAIRGKLVDNKLYGDVIIFGGGDPTFSLEDADTLISKMHSMGIHEITGDIVLIDSYFTEERLPIGWAWHYLDARYAPELSALSINRNCINVRIEATGIGKPARVTIEPATKYVKLINKMITKKGDDNIIIYRKPEANIIYVDGTIDIGRIRNIEVAVKDPTMFFGQYFKERLAVARIKFDGTYLLEEEYSFPRNDTAYVIDSIVSAPVFDILKELSIESVNLFAETIVKTLGAGFRSEGSFSAGISVMKEFLSMCGVDTSNISLWDGSGLSRHNLISPYYVALILRYMYRSQLFEDFYTVLPSPGEGTLENRFSKFNDVIRAKTGTLDAISCLSGYINVNNRDYCFSMMFNNFVSPRKKIEKIQEDIIKILVDNLKGER